MSKYQDLIEKLEQQTRDAAFEVYIPSKGKKHKISPLNTRQHREILKCYDTSLTGKIKTSMCITRIVTECYNMHNDDELLTVDIPVIVMALRAKHIGEEYTCQLDEQLYTVSLNEIISEAEKTPLDEIVKTSEMKLACEFKDIVVNLAFPTCYIDTIYNKEVIEQSSIFKDDSEFVLQVLDIMATAEIAKHIKTISVNGDIHDINTTYTCKSAMEIVKSLPLDITTQVVKFIKSCNNIQDSYIAITDTATLPLNSSFFTTD